MNRHWNSFPKLKLFLLCTFSIVQLWGRNLPIHDSDNCQFKYLETAVAYDHFNKGFFEGNFTCYRNAFNTFALFSSHTISSGYSPWHKAFEIGTENRLELFIFSAGCGIGYCTELAKNVHAWYVNPEVGLNVFFLQIYYQYSFTFRNQEIYKPGSSFFIRIPICSSSSFYDFKEKKSWHWGSFYYE